MEPCNRVSRLIGWAGMVAAVLITDPAAAASLALTPEAESVRCADVRPGEKFEFQGHALLETPDIDEPDLRLANALLSERCLDQAVQLFTEFATAHPDNYHVFFLKARWQWVVMGAQMGRLRAQVMAETALRGHPDFSSMKVLLASMYIDDQKLEEAAKLLDEVEKLHPEDLWLYMDRLRIEANLVPTPATVTALSAVVADTRFPPSARAQALHTAKYEMSDLSNAQRDAIFEQSMAAGSVNDCALVGQAEELIEFRGDAAAGARVIEKNLRRSGACLATPDVRAVLAEAYLLEAAKIAPKPTPANATLTRQAKEAVNGDLMRVARRAAARPILAPILPFLKGSMDVRQADDNGYTLICQATMATNPAMVKAQLAEGADPNGQCGVNGSLVKSLLLRATSGQIPEHQLILRSLLERGARVELLDSCADRGNGNCATIYLPILKEFDERRAKTREVL
jgi:tetratricopeptide (TPR) repeat protein